MAAGDAARKRAKREAEDAEWTRDMAEAWAESKIDIIELKPVFAKLRETTSDTLWDWQQVVRDMTVKERVAAVEEGKRLSRELETFYAKFDRKFIKRK